MSWVSIDALDNAVKRTKKVLLEPFNFWKWIKLGIIVLFIGGGGGGSFNPGGYNRQYHGEPLPTMDEIMNQASQIWHQYFIIILAVVAFIVLLILFFGFVSNIMEFVLVESLVTDVVSFWAYTRKFLRPGFNLFVIRLVIGLFFLSLFLVFMLVVVRQVMESFENIGAKIIISIILEVVSILLGLAIVNGIIQSFINLSIPLAMYNDMGIIEAIKSIVGKAGEDWKQIGGYWIIRILISLAGSIIVGIAAIILFLLIFVILAIPALVLYFILWGAEAQTLFWILMVPYVLVGIIVFFMLALLVSVPVPVFKKYHMLTFLQMWHKDVRIPFQEGGLVIEKPGS